MSNRKLLFYISFGIIAGAIGLYFRLYPLFFYTTPEANEKATLLIISQLKKTVTADVYQNFPDLSAYQKSGKIKKDFDDLLHKEGIHVRETIDRVARQIDAETGLTHPPYLLESDSYNYYNLTENILKTGKISDTIKGSKYLNKLMIAPLGFYEPLNLHPYVGYFVYKISKIFDSGIALMFALGFTSLFLTVLALIAFLCVCYNLRFSPVITFVASLFFILSPIFIKRSCFGWYDDDPYNIFFPLLILFFLFRGLDSDSFKKKVLYGSVVSLLTMAYAFFWQGWMYLFTIIMMSGMAIIFLRAIVFKNPREAKEQSTYWGIILGITFLSIAIVFGIEDFFVLFQEGWKALREFLAPPLALWPDIYVSVGELKKATLADVAEFTGGFFFLIMSVVGLGTSMIQSLRKPDRSKISKLIVIYLLFFSAFFLTLGAQRFALLCVVPLSLLLAIGLQDIFEFLHSRLEEKSVEFRTYLNIFIALILISLTIIPIHTAKSSTLSLLNRIFNETWNKALTKIERETPENSIINTWWPPGHFIKAIAHRRVTFDGATINKPQAYWMANVFLNSDEKKALGLLRMINDSANLATDYLQSLNIDLSKVVEILKDITPLDEKSARRYLRGILKEDQINHLLSLTHVPPPPSYLLIYNELVEKNLVLSFVDRWNFKKLEEISKSPDRRKLVPSRKSKEYVEFLWQIAGGPLKFSETLTQLGQHQNIMLFEENLQINLEELACKINSKKFGKGIPQNLVFLKDGQWTDTKLSGGTLPFSVVLFKDADHYNCILMDQRLADSILMRLYFFDGEGLKYFRPFTKEADLTKRTQIEVYEVKWKDFLADVGNDQ